jgi:hypothetical protein
MGSTLDRNKIRELAATIASEVVKAISELRLVSDSRSAIFYGVAISLRS